MNYIIFGFIAGIGMALGLGGGTILILLLNLFTDIVQLKIQGINLIFFIGSSCIAIYMNLKKQNINFKIVRTMIFYGIIGTIIGAILSNKFSNNNLFKKYFGIFLICIAINGTYTLISQYIKNPKDKNSNVKKK